jgi:hypothetical protein
MEGRQDHPLQFRYEPGVLFTSPRLRSRVLRRGLVGRGGCWLQLRLMPERPALTWQQGAPPCRRRIDTAAKTPTSRSWVNPYPTEGVLRSPAPPNAKPAASGVAKGCPSLQATHRHRGKGTHIEELGQSAPPGGGITCSSSAGSRGVQPQRGNRVSLLAGETSTPRRIHPHGGAGSIRTPPEGVPHSPARPKAKASASTWQQGAPPCGRSVDTTAKPPTWSCRVSLYTRTWIERGASGQFRWTRFTASDFRRRLSHDVRRVHLALG